MNVTIISKEKFDELNAVSTERAASGYTAKQEAIEAELERTDGNTETAELVCKLEGSHEDWASHYISADESLLYAPVSQRYLMTQDQYAWWEEALAAIERGEDPFPFN